MVMSWIGCLLAANCARQDDMRRRAAITDAELNRVLRVARKHGYSEVEVKTADASFTLRLGDSVDSVEKPKAKVARQVRTLL